jgi:hypothetical protein
MPMRGMPNHRYTFALAIGFAIAGMGFARAADPLRLVPNNADLIVRIDEPRRLLETMLDLEAFRQLQNLHSVREAYDSTNYRRFLQLVTHVEKELGMKWPELLDQLSGGGALAAFKFDKQPPAVEFVIQGKDDAILRKFMDLACVVIEGELARQEGKDKLERKSHRKIETLHIGKDFNVAGLGSAIVVSNDAERLNKLIDLNLDGGENMTGVTGLADAKKLLPAKPLAWAWLNMETMRQLPGAKDVFAQPRNDPNLTVAFGGWLDVARRSPFLCAALYKEGERVVTTVRMPSGRDGMPAELATHIPPTDADTALPLLQPKGVLFSTSYYLDIGKFWECRDKLFNETIAKAFEDADKKAAPFLAGNKMSTMLTQTGPHQRLVAVYQPQTGYPKGPFGFVGQLGYAFVVDMRDPALGKSLDTLARAGGFLARTFGQIKLKLFEEKYQDVNIIGYRQEDSDRSIRVNAENNPLAYLPSPCYAAVGNQFIAASTVELTKELIDILQKESKMTPAKPDGKASRTRVYGEGGAELLNGIQDILLAQTILDQALSPSEAREEVRRGVEWVRSLGAIEIESQYGPKEFRYDVILAPQKQNNERRAKKTE